MRVIAACAASGPGISERGACSLEWPEWAIKPGRGVVELKDPPPRMLETKRGQAILYCCTQDTDHESIRSPWCGRRAAEARYSVADVVVSPRNRLPTSWNSCRVSK